MNFIFIGEELQNFHNSPFLPQVVAGPPCLMDPSFGVSTFGKMICVDDDVSSKTPTEPRIRRPPYVNPSPRETAKKTPTDSVRWKCWRAHSVKPVVLTPETFIWSIIPLSSLPHPPSVFLFPPLPPKQTSTKKRLFTPTWRKRLATRIPWDLTSDPKIANLCSSSISSEISIPTPRENPSRFPRNVKLSHRVGVCLYCRWYPLPSSGVLIFRASGNL